jgi:phosphatidylinositol kinase/protein kinase (PI-3  family)
MAVLEAFVYDPLINWRLFTKPSPKQPGLFMLFTSSLNSFFSILIVFVFLTLQSVTLKRVRRARRYWRVEAHVDSLQAENCSGMRVNTLRKTQQPSQRISMQERLR